MKIYEVNYYTARELIGGLFGKFRTIKKTFYLKNDCSSTY